MDPSKNPSLDSQCSFPTNTPSKAPRLPRCFTTWRHLGHGRNAKSLSLEIPRNERQQGTLEDSARPQSAETQQVMWKRRGHTPGMDDYLTLEQLEDVWFAQDFYVGCVSAPQEATQYSYTEAVEAPLVAEHSPNARRQQISQSSGGRNRPLPDIPLRDSSDSIDYDVHPALRPVPYLKTSSTAILGAASLGPLAIAVPDTNWTYGRE